MIVSVLLLGAACAGRLEALRDAVQPSEPELVIGGADLIAPEGLQITSTEDRQIAIAWEPVLVGDVEGYAIMRAPTPDRDFVLVGRTGSRFYTVFSDLGSDEQRLGDGTTYHYRVHAFDSRRRVARNFASVSATTNPRPGPPLALETYSNLPRRAVLRWEPSPDRSVSGYAVYRSPSTAGPWELVTSIDGRLQTLYEDEIPGDLRVMYYRLRALNRFGGESEMSDPTRAVTKPEPLPPTAVRQSERALGAVTIAWEANVERDIVRYEVFRATAEAGVWNDEGRLARVPASLQSFRDREIGCGELVRYRVRVRDADGLQSSMSEALEVTGEDIGLRIEVSPSGPVLSWSQGLAAEGWTGARVVERHRLRPDNVVAELEGVSQVSLAELGEGIHRLSVALMRSRVHAEDGRSEAPACTLVVELPFEPTASRPAPTPAAPPASPAEAAGP